MARCRRSTFTNEKYIFFFFPELLLYACPSSRHISIDKRVATNSRSPNRRRNFKQQQQKKKERDCGIHVTSQVKMYVQEKERKNYSHGCCR